MGEASSGASTASGGSKKAAGGGSGAASTHRGSRSAGPGPDGKAAGTKKRSRSETPSGSNAEGPAHLSPKGSAPDETGPPHGSTKKKKKTAGSDLGGGSSGQPPAEPSRSSYRDEIASASSEAIEELLSSSLYRMTDGIPVRELRLVVSEAEACEAALEAELGILARAIARETQRGATSCGGGSGPAEGPAQPPAKPQTKAKTTEEAAPSPEEEKALLAMLGAEFTPPDAHWTLSALLGRLRHELTTPLPPSSQLPAHREKNHLTQLAQSVGIASQYSSARRKAHPSGNATGSNTNTNTNTNNTNSNSNSSNSNNTSSNNKQATATATEAANAVPSAGTTGGGQPGDTSELSQFRRLGSLPGYPEYTREHASNEKLLGLCKKIYNYRSSLVFRKPVNPTDAPGYTERIKFPMDISLIRKLVLSGHIRTYEGILRQVHLIGHNCVKYNGRESDYALVTREFESVATEYVWTAVIREARGWGGRGGHSRTTSPMPGAAPAPAPAVNPTPAASATAPRPAGAPGKAPGTGGRAALPGGATGVPAAAPAASAGGNTGIRKEQGGASAP